MLAGVLGYKPVYVTSQNGRGWWGPLEIIKSNPHAKAGSLEHVTQDSIQVDFEYL